MSRIGKKPVPVPKGVKVGIGDGSVKVEGPKGTVTMAYTVRRNNAGDFALPPAGSRRCTRPRCLARRRMRG